LSASSPDSNTSTAGGALGPVGYISTNQARSFHARGVVRGLPADGESIVVRHEAIPGFMPRMTMTFTVRQTNELRSFRPGDAISFTVKATDEDSWIENLRKTDGKDLAPATPVDPSSSSLLKVAKIKVGEELPDAELKAEDGRVIRLSDFRGQVLAFTFIFSRCPLPDYCPRMNLHFQRARELLISRERQQGVFPTNWQFLSISFDPEFDTPNVLQRYAQGYRGAKADRWLFASALDPVMKTFGAQLDFRFANEGGSFLHNLRTVVLDPQGRVYRQFDGNRWTAQDLANALTEAASLR
jgi:protein SCO1/2